MHFLNPVFLYLLPFSLVPLLLFFLGRKSRNKISFSSVYLLYLSKSKGLSKEKFRLYLLLIIRILLILSILLLFAHIRVSGRWFNRVYFDVSSSMQSAGKSRVRKLMHLVNEVYGKKRVVEFSYFHPDSTRFYNDSTYLGPIVDSSLVVSDLKFDIDTTKSIFYLCVRGKNTGIRVKKDSGNFVISAYGLKDLAVLNVCSPDSVLKSVDISPFDTIVKLPRTAEDSGYLLFYLKTSDNLADDNVYYMYVMHRIIKVDDMSHNSVLKSFFSVSGFENTKDSADIMVDVDHYPAGKAALKIVFLSSPLAYLHNFGIDMEKIIGVLTNGQDTVTNPVKLRGGKVAFYLKDVPIVLYRHVNNQKLLVVGFAPGKGSNLFYNPVFVDSMYSIIVDANSNTITKSMSFYSFKPNAECRRVKFRNEPDADLHAGIYNCNGNVFVANMSRNEVMRPARCRHVAKSNLVSIKDIERNLIFEKILIILIIVLFIAELYLSVKYREL